MRAKVPVLVLVLVLENPNPKKNPNPARKARARARRLYHVLVFAWLAAIVALVAAFFPNGLLVVVFMLLGCIPLLNALLKNPLAPAARIGAMAQICGLNIALGAFYAAAVFASTVPLSL